MKSLLCCLLALAGGLVVASAPGAGVAADDAAGRAPAGAPPAVGVPPAVAASPAPRSRPAPVAAVSCKPQAPIDVRIEQRAAVGARVELQFSIRPLVELRDVRWHLELPPGAAPLAGLLAGEVGGGRGVASEGRVEVLVPDDDTWRRVRLHVSATMTGSDETGAVFDEPIAASATLSWGTPPAPAPVVLTPDPETRALAPAVALPVRHRPGR